MIKPLSIDKCFEPRCFDLEETYRYESQNDAVSIGSSHESVYCEQNSKVNSKSADSYQMSTQSEHFVVIQKFLAPETGTIHHNVVVAEHLKREN